MNACKRNFYFGWDTLGGFFGVLLISFVMSSVVTAVVRQFDGGSDKMRKLKRFADNALSELNQKIDPKVKDLSFAMTEFDTKYDQAKAAVKRMEALQSAADEKSQILTESLLQIDSMKLKLDEYEKELSGLLQMTDAVEKNLNALKDQNEVISNLSRTFDGQKADAQNIASRLNKIETDFENANAKKIKALEEQIFAEFHEQVNGLSENAERSVRRTEELFMHIDEKVTEGFTEAARRAGALEDAAFNALKNKFEAHHEELSVTLREIKAGREESAQILAALMQELEEYKTDMLYRFEKLKTEAPDIERFGSDINELVIKTEAQIREDFFAFSREQTGEYMTFQTEIGDRADKLARQVGEIESIINDLQSSAYENANSKIRAFETRITENMNERTEEIDAKFAEWMREAKSRLTQTEVSVANEAAQKISACIEEVQKKMRLLENETENAKSGASSKISECIEDVQEKMRTLENEFENAAEKIRAFEAEISDNIDESRKDMSANVASKMSELEETVKTEATEKIDSYIEKVQEKMRLLASETENAKSDASSKISEYIDEVQKKMQLLENETENAKSGASSKIDECIEDVQEKMRILENEFENAAEKIRAFEAEISDNIDESRKDMSANVAEKMSELEETVKTEATEKIDSYIEEVQEKMRLLANEAENAKSGASSKISECIGDMWEKMRTLENEFENANAKILSFEAAVSANIDSRTKEVDENLAAWMRTVESTVKTAAAETIAARIKELQEKINALETDFEKRHDKLTKNTAERIEEDFLKISEPLHAEIEQIRGDIDSLDTHAADAQTVFKTLLEKNNDLSAKLQMFDSQIHSFIEHTATWKKAETTKEEFEKSLSVLHSDIAKTEAIKPVVQTINAEFERLQNLQTDVEQKMLKIESDRKYIQTLQADFERLADLEQSVRTKMSEIQASRDTITALEVKARELSDGVAEIMTRYDRLESKNEVLERTNNDVDAAFGRLKELEAELQLRKTEIDGMKTIQESIPKITEASAKLNNMGAIIIDAEKRIQAVSAERDGIRKTEERLVHLAAEADRKFEILKGIAAKEAKNLPFDNSKTAIDMQTKETVRDLAKLGWSYKEIAVSVKLTEAEVELILDTRP